MNKRVKMLGVGLISGAVALGLGGCSAEKVWHGEHGASVENVGGDVYYINIDFFRCLGFNPTDISREKSISEYFQKEFSTGLRGVLHDDVDFIGAQSARFPSSEVYGVQFHIYSQDSETPKQLAKYFSENIFKEIK